MKLLQQQVTNKNFLFVGSVRLSSAEVLSGRWNTPVLCWRCNWSCAPLPKHSHVCFPEREFIFVQFPFLDHHHHFPVQYNGLWTKFQIEMLQFTKTIKLAIKQKQFLVFRPFYKVFSCCSQQQTASNCLNRCTWLLHYCTAFIWIISSSVLFTCLLLLPNCWTFHPTCFRFVEENKKRK